MFADHRKFRRRDHGFPAVDERPFSVARFHTPATRLIKQVVIQGGVSARYFGDKTFLGAVDDHAGRIVTHDVEFVVGVGVKIPVPVEVFLKQRSQHSGVWRNGQAVALITRYLRNNPVSLLHIPQRNSEVAPQDCVYPVCAKDVVCERAGRRFTFTARNPDDALVMTGKKEVGSRAQSNATLRDPTDKRVMTRQARRNNGYCGAFGKAASIGGYHERDLIAPVRLPR